MELWREQFYWLEKEMKVWDYGEKSFIGGSSSVLVENIIKGVYKREGRETWQQIVNEVVLDSRCCHIRC